MVKEEFDQEEVDEMRQMLHHEGWETSQNLPNYWFVRKPKSTSLHIR